MLPYLVTMGCTTEGSLFNCQQDERYFSTPERPEEFWGSTHPPLQWVHVLLSLGIKWPEREACCPSPSNDEVKKEWSYASIVCGGATYLMFYL